jgi:L-aspartate oxidase
MPARHPLAELAPRDVVAREIVRAQRDTGGVRLDATPLASRFERRFPFIFAACRAHGIDPRAEPIPVTPAAHFIMGGIVTDLAGRTSLARLWAVGEVARTGVHGANRLASNSLLEGLVFADRVARDLASVAPLASLPPAAPWTVPLLQDIAAARTVMDGVRALMWEHAGILRTARGLRHCLESLDHLAALAPAGALDARNMLATARLIARAALLRDESRGAHFRADAVPSGARELVTTSAHAAEGSIHDRY